VSKESTTDTTIVNDITYEDTGIILTVTPHINSGGLVRLEVEQNIRTVNDQQLAGINLNTPRFSERVIKTSLVAEHGKTVVIGGIIQSQKTNIKTGIPILGSIPILSFFFSSTQETLVKTELIVAITPHVVNRGDDKISREFIDKLNNLREKINAE